MHYMYISHVCMMTVLHDCATVPKDHVYFTCLHNENTAGASFDSLVLNINLNCLYYIHPINKR